MAFLDYWKINGGILLDEIIGSVTTFPQMSNISSCEHRALDDTQWLDGPKWRYFNEEISTQIDILDIIESIPAQDVDPSSVERRIASIPLFSGVGILRHQTGNLCIGVTRETAYRYVFRCYITDLDNNELGNFWGSASTEYPSGGAWEQQPYRMFLALCRWSDGLGHDYLGMYSNASKTCLEPYNNEYGSWWRAGGGAIRFDLMESVFGIAVDDIGDPIPFSPEFGDGSAPDGGYNDVPDNPHGTFDFHSDTVPVPNLPSVGVTTAGFINVYKISQGALTDLGEKLFPHFLPAEILADPSQLSIQQVLTWFVKMAYGTLIEPVGTSIEMTDNLGIVDVLMNGKLIDYILDCHIIPVDITAGINEGLKVGYRQFNDIQLPRASSDYVEVNCGTLATGEAFRNFLDFSACTMKLFLPFVGFVPIQPEYWNGGEIGVKYHFNIVDGSFQVYVTSTSGKSKLKNTVIAQYGGVCCVHLPITGLQYSNVVAGLVNGTGGAVASVMGGNPAGAVTNAFNMSMLRPDAPSSNGYNASSSFLSERIPYLLIEYPSPQFSTQYNKELGLPLNVSRTLSSVHGFTVIDNPVLKIACSDNEYNELVSLLKSGVILP